MDAAYIQIYSGLQSPFLNFISHGRFPRRSINVPRYHASKSKTPAARLTCSLIGESCRHLMTAMSIPALAFLPSHGPPVHFSYCTQAAVSADCQAPPRKSLAFAVRAVSAPSVTAAQQKSHRFAVLQAVVPNSRDSRLHTVLKCALLAAMISSVVTAATIAVFWVIQDSLVYKPTKVWRGNPKSSGMPFYDDVNYCTFDGVEISGWFIKQSPETYCNSRTLIYFHGTDKNASFRLKKVVGFYEQCRCNVLLLSYRGYGLSSGRPNERGMCIDAESALDYLSSRGDVDVSPGGNLWVYGESLGGAVAVHFTKVYQDRVNALILENTFTSLLDMIKLEFPILGVFRYLSRNRWQSKRRIRDIKTPILFLSGLRDSYIPPRMMRQMHELANQSKLREFVEFEKGTHNRTWTMDGFYGAVASFMERVEGESHSDSGSEPTNFSGDDNGFFAATA